jgi:glutamate N-acetyltransferase/amino-acid N-acetyltransferase
MSLKPSQVLPSSTGVIGWRLPVDAMVKALPSLVAKLTGGSVLPAAEGIVTTGLYPKVRRAQVGAGPAM